MSHYTNMRLLGIERQDGKRMNADETVAELNSLAAKLDAKSVSKARKATRNGKDVAKTTALALKLGISRSAFYAAVTGQTWKHVA